MKIALCLVGMIGSKTDKHGYGGEHSEVLNLGYKHYKKHILDKNDVDVFCHTSRTDFSDEVEEFLKELKDQPVIFEELENKTAYLEQGMRTIFEKHNLSVCINRVGSMLSFHFNITEVANFDDACAADAEYFKKVFHGMLKRGVYLAPSAFESLFISRTHTKELLDRTLTALDQTIIEIEG